MSYSINGFSESPVQRLIRWLPKTSMYPVYDENDDIPVIRLKFLRVSLGQHIEKQNFWKNRRLSLGLKPIRAKFFKWKNYFSRVA